MVQPTVGAALGGRNLDSEHLLSAEENLLARRREYRDEQAQPLFSRILGPGVSWWSNLRSSTEGALGLIPGQRTRIWHAAKG